MIKIINDIPAIHDVAINMTYQRQIRQLVKTIMNQLLIPPSADALIGLAGRFDAKNNQIAVKSWVEKEIRNEQFEDISHLAHDLAQRLKFILLDLSNDRVGY